MEKDKCGKQKNGEHLVSLKRNKYVLRHDPVIGVVADVVCTHCAKTGAVRLHWEEVNWDEDK